MYLDVGAFKMAGGGFFLRQNSVAKWLKKAGREISVQSAIKAMHSVNAVDGGAGGDAWCHMAPGHRIHPAICVQFIRLTGCPLKMGWISLALPNPSTVLIDHADAGLF